MTYDFDQIIDRRATPSIKWHLYNEDVLPMWVADMDFRSPEPVIQALHERVAHGVFGYEAEPSALREVIVARLKRHYDWTVTSEALVFLPGVVPGFNMALRAFVAPEEALLIQTPVYPPILSAADEAGRRCNAMALSRGADGHYEVDFDRFAELAARDSRLFILCNPHNPVGRVFRREELLRMAEICLEHDVLICSDEIHGDLIFQGQRHLPIASLAPEIAEQSITLLAPSKTYNIAGLCCAFAVIPNAELRKQFKSACNHIVEGANLLGYTAALAAYSEGQPWLDAALDYMQANRDFVARVVSEQMPGVAMAKPEGTYLAWLDCRAAAIPGKPHTFFLEQARVALNDGETFGPGGEGFVRLNFGCPRALLEQGLAQMVAALEKISFPQSLPEGGK